MPIDSILYCRFQCYRPLEAWKRTKTGLASRQRRLTSISVPVISAILGFCIWKFLQRPVPLALFVGVISALLGYGLVVLWEWLWHLAHIPPETHAAMVKEIAALQPDSAPREADRKTLEDFLQILPSDGGIERLRDHNFAGFSLDYDWFSDINRFFLTRKDRPEYEFLEPDLERLRKELLQSISVLFRALSQHAFWVEGSNTRQSVPEEWETEQPARFEKAVNEIHKAAEDTCASYDAFVRAARSLLMA